MKVSEAIDRLKIGDTVWVKGRVEDLVKTARLPFKLRLDYAEPWIGTKDDISLTEPSEKVKIPECVGKWIDFCKEQGVSLHTAMNWFSDLPEEIETFYEEMYSWLTDENYQEHEEIFARAWLDGFTVETKRWVVKFVMIDGVRYFSKFNGCNDLDYNYVGRKENAHIFTDKAKAEAVATLVEGSVEEVAE